MSQSVGVVPAQSQSGGFGLFAGHPKGLPTLFFTEMWERFSYYGMRALLVLYMVALPTDGGLGFDNKNAGEIYGTYTMMVYMMSIPGGFVADRFLGRKLSILIGGSIIALGHFTLAFANLYTFYGGLVLIIIGTGMLKPNMSTLLGTLYGPDDHRRDAGFSIYYMGINIGATLAPLVCGFLAQSNEFKAWLQSMNLDPHSSWHWGFAAAGVGMIFGLVNFVICRDRLVGVGDRPIKLPVAASATAEVPGPGAAAAAQLELEIDLEKSSGATPPGETAPDETAPGETAKIEPPKSGKLTPEELKRIGAIAVLFCFNILFWAIYEQGGSSLNLFADKLTDCRINGWAFPSTWLQSLQAAFVIILAPMFSWLWVKLGDKDPSSPTKFAIGLTFLGLGIGLMVPAATLAQQGKVSPLWLIMVYLFQVIGEMCLSPVGLSTVTK
ncbi:MAG: peptide MFS transporter, partial [Leptolyngbya sp.]|nr:peptide MFS transporter [Candidatus Melainabacteria bacterium]